MFPGENGCFCCPDPPDPPPDCVDCVVCQGVGPDGCEGVVCQNFVLEVENWANSPTTEQDAGLCGGTGTGTMCGAYNGTFPLTRYDDESTPCSTPPWSVMGIPVAQIPAEYDCCEWRSDTFIATTPTFTEVNGKKCVVCEDVEVYYRMQFLKWDNAPALPTRVIVILICKAIDGMWIATAKPELRAFDVNDTTPDYGSVPPCSPEEFTEDGERLFYFLRWYNLGGQAGLFSNGVESNQFEGPHAQNSPICGPDGGFLYFSQDLENDPCFEWTVNSEGAQWEVQYPFWNCCKDADWNGCATMQDWAQNGIPGPCGGDARQGVKEYLPVRLTCAD